jgi:hypothetical protein
MFSVFSSSFLTSLEDTESDFSGFASVFSFSLQLPSSEPSVNSVAAAVIGK